MKTFIKAAEKEHSVLVRYRENDEVKVEDILFRNYIFIKKEDFSMIYKEVAKFSDKATPFSAVNGEFVKIYLNNNYDRYKLKNMIERFNIEVFEGDISSAKRYLIDRGPEYDFKNFKVIYLDFETDDRGTFDKDEFGVVIAGKKQILSCALLDEDGKEWYFRNKNPDDPNADSEYELIVDILNVLKKYDTVAAWNGHRFDYPYLQQRMDFHSETRKINFDNIFNLKL